MTQTTTPSTQSSVPLPDVFSNALASLFDAAQPSIVQVHVSERGGGTGVIWGEDGRIITNNHVVARDNVKVQVALADGRTFDAQVLHREPRLDLAMLKIQGDQLKALPFGDSSKLCIGEWVFAIGHPWGQRWVVTAGIASAKRTARREDFSTEYIQSDVPLAPGNSGGPLLNADGEVVGINAMIFGGDLSVAIPSNVVNKWVTSLSKGGVKLGIEIMTVEIPANMRQELPSQQDSGVFVVGISPERQEKYNDLFVGDILLEIVGKSVKDTTSLLQVLAQQQGGKPLAATILRGGKVVRVDVGVLA